MLEEGRIEPAGIVIEVVQSNHWATETRKTASPLFSWRYSNELQIWGPRDDVPEKIKFKRKQRFIGVKVAGNPFFVRLPLWFLYNSRRFWWIAEGPMLVTDVGYSSVDEYPTSVTNKKFVFYTLAIHVHRHPIPSHFLECSENCFANKDCSPNPPFLCIFWD